MKEQVKAVPHRVLLLGGARSGKSRLGEALARRWGGDDVTYIATAEIGDAEMARRIELHRSQRPSAWTTWEGAAEELPQVVASLDGVVLMDCLTVWLSRLFLADGQAEGDDEALWHESERRILASVETLLDSARAARAFIAVSNEVGSGLVPTYLMGRRFRDLQGRANQLAAAKAETAALVVAGLPLLLKGSLDDGR